MFCPKKYIHPFAEGVANGNIYYCWPDWSRGETTGYHSSGGSYGDLRTVVKPSKKILAVEICQTGGCCADLSFFDGHQKKVKEELPYFVHTTTSDSKWMGRKYPCQEYWDYNDSH